VTLNKEVNIILPNLVLRVFVLPDQLSKTRDSGSNHFEITKETTEFCPSGFTAVCMPEMVAPRVSRFLTAGQGERRLWERDCILPNLTHSYKTKKNFTGSYTKVKPYFFMTLCNDLYHVLSRHSFAPHPPLLNLLWENESKVT